MTTKEISVQEQFAQVKSEYRMSKDSRHVPKMRGVNPIGTGADYHIGFGYDYYKILERARWHAREDVLVSSAINRLSSNVIGTGFQVDPQTGNAELNARLKELWNDWADDADACHSEGECTFSQIEELVFRSTITDGDIFTLLRKDGSLQLVEGHRVKTPSNTKKNVVLGIELDGDAKRKSIWVTKEDVNPLQTVTRVSDVHQIAVRDVDGNRNVLQSYLPKRTSQRRGVSAIAPVSEKAGMHDDLQFSTLVKAQMASLIVLLESQAQQVAVGGIQPQAGAQGAIGQVPAPAPTSVTGIPGLTAGLHVKTATGNKLEGFSPNIPGDNHFQHSYLLITLIAIAFDVSPIVLLLDPQKSNFSSYRGALEQARLRYKQHQQHMIKQWHRKIYAWKVRQWIAMDPIASELAKQSGVSPYKHRFTAAELPYLEPQKDAASDQVQQSSFLNSPRRLQLARGRDWDEVCKEIVDDKAQLIRLALEAAKQLNTEFPEAELTWRDILSPGLSAVAATNTKDGDGDGITDEQAATA